MKHFRNAVLCVTMALVVMTLPARAAVVFFNDLANFQTVSQANLAVTFDPFANVNNNIGALTLNGITFTPLLPDSPNLNVASPANPNFAIARTSNVLTSSGNEDIALTFASSTGAVGFDVYANNAAAPVVSVFDTANSLIGQLTLTQGPATHGFFGVTASVPIGKVIFLATSGEVVNTGIDDVRVAPIPEPSALTIMAILLVPIGCLKRRHRDSR